MRQWALFGAGLAVLAAGCGGAETAKQQRVVEDQTLVIALPSQPENLNPIAADSVYEGNQKFFNGLLRYAKDLTPEPDLAAALPTRSADGRKVTVKLRDDVSFHDGTPLTAEDVVFTYNAVLDPDSASPLATLLDSLKSRARGRCHDSRVHARPAGPGVLRQAPDRHRPGACAAGPGPQDDGVQPQADRHRPVRPQGVQARRADRDGGQPGLLPRRAEDQARSC